MVNLLWIRKKIKNALVVVVTLADARNANVLPANATERVNSFYGMNDFLVTS